MTLETSFRMVAVAGLTLVVWTFGCQTRTPIGEVPDAGEGNDAWLDDGAVGPGTGGTAGGQGGRTGAGGHQSGSGGAPAQGGDTGAGGSLPGQGGAGGSPAMGGAPGTAACQTIGNPSGIGGQGVVACSPFIYPASGFYGDNILAGGCTTFTSSVNYDLAVRLPSTSATVQVTLTALSFSGGAATAGRSGSSSPGWYYVVDGDWRVKTYDPQTKTQLFQTRPLSENETMMKFEGVGSARVDIYECDLNTPARSKTISWAPASP